MKSLVMTWHPSQFELAFGTSVAVSLMLDSFHSTGWLRFDNGTANGRTRDLTVSFPLHPWHPVNDKGGTAFQTP